MGENGFLLPFHIQMHVNSSKQVKQLESVLWMYIQPNRTFNLIVKVIIFAYQPNHIRAFVQGKHTPMPAAFQGRIKLIIFAYQTNHKRAFV